MKEPFLPTPFCPTCGRPPAESASAAPEAPRDWSEGAGFEQTEAGKRIQSTVEKSRDKWMRVAEREAKSVDWKNAKANAAAIEQVPARPAHTLKVYGNVHGKVAEAQVELAETAAERDRLREEVRHYRVALFNERESTSKALRKQGEQVKELLAACKGLLQAYAPAAEQWAELPRR